MSYETLKVKAQKKADETGKHTCIAEDYSGYKVCMFNERTMFSKAVQDVFEPGGKGPVL